MKRSDRFAIRTVCGLSQVDFAKVLNVHPMTVSRWERGQIEPDGVAEQLYEVLRTRLVSARFVPVSSSDFAPMRKFLKADKPAKALESLLAVAFNSSRVSGGELGLRMMDKADRARRNARLRRLRMRRRRA